ncbi:heterokaryon incompatibility protein-domain-containing protein [Biscogniauxia sp. FL1348]|nr:heterokaryon incompatibility protein-domain-containing protein [Biscogniauxia sp. FL1348]
MSQVPEDSDDLRCSLLEISRSRLGSKITTQLVEIQSAKIEQEKPLDFIHNLECLYSDGHESKYFSRRIIDAFTEPRYVALSYTWQPSPVETELSTGRYWVQRRDFYSFDQSPVRDSVFMRVKKYMCYRNVRYLWIDQHCIEQEGNAKQRGMHAMDRVYSKSMHPVALLATTIESLEERELLVRILEGQFVCDDGREPRLSPGTTRDQAFSAIELLTQIVSDTWFDRAWTFQENYRAGTNMILLIKYSLRNATHDLLGYLDGELCVPSVEFHDQATKLCVACNSSLGLSCDYILERVGKYTVLLQRRVTRGGSYAPKSMSPMIIANLAARKLMTSWERLTIAANCCQYSVRLDCLQLQDNGHSLSLSMLALCLLNGEILANHHSTNSSVANTRSLNIVEFLDTQLLNLRPLCPAKALTFNKGCRFDEVRLTKEGVQTKGHIWKCGNMILPESFQRSYRRRFRRRYQNHYGSSPSKMGQSGPESPNYRHLRELARIVQSRGEYSLYRRLTRFIRSLYNTWGPLTFSKNWKSLMATMIAKAIDQGKTLCTAYLINEPEPNGAIFIVENAEHGTRISRNESVGSTVQRASCKMPKYVFTSIRPEYNDSEMVDRNDLDKHVTMEVDLDNSGDSRRPRLFTGPWIYGLCFFYNCPRQEVVFPWPASLKGL